ncbi:hypothetical protein M0R45_029906 [Rubus argutus]|uniref:Uncharacterized protein n=1 Tax=Rubus argutus TaxID=59490 RepID=A0AAW1W934_RUBAR
MNGCVDSFICNFTRPQAQTVSYPIHQPIAAPLPQSTSISITHCKSPLTSMATITRGQSLIALYTRSSTADVISQWIPEPIQPIPVTAGRVTSGRYRRSSPPPAEGAANPVGPAIFFLLSSFLSQPVWPPSKLRDLDPLPPVVTSGR